MAYPVGMKNIPALTIGLLLLLLSGCAGTGTPAADPVPDPPQDIQLADVFADLDEVAAQPAFQPARRRIPVVTLAVAGTIDPGHAPLPAGDAEQLVFHQCYRTLTSIALDGTVQPALAAHWQSFRKHRRWEVTLARDVRFWDGTAVTAQAVLASWQATAYRTTATPSAPDPLRWLQPASGRVRAVGARTLVIDLDETMPDLPAQLAHPALSVRGPTPTGEVWPLGTGPCRPLATAGGWDLVPAFPGAATWDTLRIVTATDWKPDADLVLAPPTGAEAPSGMTRVDLPWNRLYLLVCPPSSFGATENERRRWTTDLNPTAWTADLAPGTSREADAWSFLRDRQRLCPYLRLEVPSWNWPDFDWPGRTAARDRDLVLYPQDDPVAQKLAGILADHAARPLRPAEANAGRGPLTPPRRPVGGLRPQALGIDHADFEAALQAGRAGAYVLPVPRWDGSACRQLAGVLGRAPWLQDAADDDAVANQPLPAGARALKPMDYADPTEAEQAGLRLERSRVLTPLIVTRPALQIRPGLRGFGVDFQGNLDLTRVGRR